MPETRRFEIPRPHLPSAVRELLRRAAGGAKAQADPGVAGVASGARALAVTESLYCDAAVLPAATGEGAAARAVASFSQALDAEAERGETNLLGRPLRARRAPGARAALSEALGMAGAGLRVVTVLSGDDLAANLDLLREAGERRLPLVVHVVAGGGRSAGTDHGPWHAAAATGAVRLFAGSVAEAVDLALVARRTAEEAGVPVLVGVDVETALGSEDLYLPTARFVTAFLGSPDDVTHGEDPAREMLFGRHHRRLQSWHDGERPLTAGAVLPPAVAVAARAARRAYLDPGVGAALERAYAALAAATGRQRGPVAALVPASSRGLLVAAGSVAESLAAVAGARGGGVVAELLGQKRPGVIAVSAFSPFPADELSEAVSGAEVVVVLERSDDPLAEDGSLARLVRSAVDALPVRRQPRVAPVTCGVGGEAPRTTDLAALLRTLASQPDELTASPRLLGVDLAPGVESWPKRQVVADALRRAFPGAAKLTLADGQPVADPRPKGAFTVLLHSRDGGDGGELLSAAGAMLQRLAGGHVRARRDLAPGLRDADHGDRLTWAAAPLADPGPAFPAEVVLSSTPGVAPHLRGVVEGGSVVFEQPASAWRRPPGDDFRRHAEARKLRLHAVPAATPTTETEATVLPTELRRERLLGALLGTLAAEDRLTVELTTRKVAAARRELLTGTRPAPAVEALVGALQTGFDRVHPVSAADLAQAAPADAAVPAAEVPAAIRRAASRAGSASSDVRSTAGHATVDSLPRFWDQVGVAASAAGETPAPLPDPHLATGALPAASAALFPAVSGRSVLPAFDPAPCTGCGECWVACPHGAVTPRVLAPQALLETGMARVSAAGGSAEGLRMVLGKLATAVGKELAGDGSRSTAEVLDAAYAASVARTPLPESRQQAVEEAFAAVRDALAPLPLASTAAFEGDAFALALDPDACTGCGLCVEVCAPQALSAVADGPKRSRAARAVHRAVAELPAPAGAVLERAAASSEVGDLAAALLAAPARAVLPGSDAAEAGSGESLAVRQVLGAAAGRLSARRGELLARLDAVADELATAIQSNLARALPSRDLDALSRGLAGLDRPEAELADLVTRVEGAFEDRRVDVPRLAHLVEAARRVADLRWHLTEGPTGHGTSLLSVVLSGEAASWGATYPSTPFAVPVTVATAGDAAAVARGTAVGVQERALAGFSALRRARIELDAGDGANAEKKAEQEIARLARLAWTDLDEEERRLAPPLFWIASEANLVASSAAGLFDLLEGGDAVKLLLLTDGDEPRSAGGDVDLVDLARRVGTAYVAQTSIAAGDHLAAAVAEALDHDGPAVLRVHAPSPGRLGLEPGDTLAFARQAVESGAFVLLRSSAVGEDEGSDREAVVQGAGAEELEAERSRHATEMAALKADYETRLAALRGDVQKELARQVRGRLLTLALKPRAATPAAATEGMATEVVATEVEAS